MPNLKQQVKRETRVAKVRKGRSKATERDARARAKDVGDVSLVPDPSLRQPQSDAHTLEANLTAHSVPVKNFMNVKVPYGRLVQYMIASNMDFKSTSDRLAKDFELPINEEVYGRYADDVAMSDSVYIDELKYQVDGNYAFICGLAIGFDSPNILYTLIAVFSHPQISRGDAFDFLRDRFAVDMSSKEKLVDLIYDFSGWGPDDYMMYVRYLVESGVPKEIVETFRNVRFERKEWVEHKMNVGNIPIARRLELMVSYMMPNISDKMMSKLMLDAELGNSQMKTILKAMEITEGGKGIPLSGMTILDWQAKLRVVSEKIAFPSITDPKFLMLADSVDEKK